MAATELATAYLSLVPSMRGAQGAIARELASVDADGIGKDIGGRMGGGIAGSLKGMVGPAMAAMAAIGFGGMIKEAAAASDATDKFKSTMNFAGIDTSGIDAATKAAKAYADQTVYDLPTIQATMAQLASNGVTNYTDLTKAAGNLNAVAGGNAETFKSVSRTLTQSAGAGKLMTEDWNMLADAIPGASGPLQKALKDAGAYTGNFKEAMEKGQITSEEFQGALLKLGNQPVAVEAAKSVTTFEGAIGNLQATINSGLMSALDYMKPAITGAISGVSEGLGWIFGKVGGLVSGLIAIFGKGDITPTLLDALGVSEDSPVIAGLMWLSDLIFAGFQQVSNFIAGFTMPGPDVSRLWGSFDTAARLGAEAKGKVEGVLNGLKDFVSGFTVPTPALMASGFDMTPMAIMGSTFRDIFSEIGRALGPVIPDFLALWQAVSPLNTIFQALLPSLVPIGAILGNLATTVGFALMDAIIGVLPAFQSLQATMVVLFTDVLATTLPLIAQLVQMVGATLAELIPVLVPIIVQVVTLAAALIGQLAPIFMQLVSAVLPIVVSSLGLILDAIVPLVSMIASVLIPIIEALMPVVVTIFTGIANIITAAMQIVQGIIQVVTGIIAGNWSQVWDGILNIVGGVWNTIGALISYAINYVGAVIGAGLGLVGNVFRDVWNGLVGFLGGVWGNITNGVSSMIGDVINFFGGLIGKITGAIGNAGKALWDTGVNIIQGLIGGIGSMMGAIGRAVISIVPEAIRGPFEDLLGIHSPSRVFRAYGVNIGEGLVLGIEDMHGAVAAATEGLAVVPAVPDFVPAAWSTGVAVGTHAPDTGGSGSGVVQNIYPRENMSEETVAEIAARKLERAGVA